MTTAEVEGRPLPKDLVANPILSQWISVLPDGRIGVRVGKVELGQGILTALAQLAADELDVELAQVQMLAANTMSGPDEGLTSGSLSISDSGPAVRLVAANVRALFRSAAARKWRVDVSRVGIDAGRISHLADLNESLVTSYAELAADVDLDVRVDPRIPVKELDQAQLTGTSTARLDLPDKVAGRARFIHDFRMPGQLFGRVIRPPSPGAQLVDVAAPEPGMSDLQCGPGVKLVRDGSFLAVVGANEAAVVRTAEVVRAASSWEERDSLPDENNLDTYLRSGPHEIITVVDDLNETVAIDGEAEGRRLSATYSRPFIAHASMAPSCAVACWHEDGRLQVWSHSQGIHNLRLAIAGALDLDPELITVEHAEGAGCYGHNAADDAAFDAVLIARTVPGRPVQVLWSRSDELSWSPFGSAMTADITATLDQTGRLTSWSSDIFSQGHTARPGYAGVPGLLAATTLAEPAVYPAPTDPPINAGAGTTRNALPGYDLPRRRVVGHRRLTAAIRSSAIRALGAYLNVFAIESFMDEAALLAGADPLAFRLAHLSDERGQAVLKAAALKANWGSDLPEGMGRGIGYARYKGRGAYCAVVAEVEAEAEIRVRRLTIAVDVGRVVNPDGVRNQIEGGATQSASWTLKERVRFDRRRVTSTDWESYPILRFSEAPEVDVVLVETPRQPSVGSGEAAQGPTAAAIANAVAAALGVRVRRLPLTTEAVIAAIEAD
jgi:CO/xanthine dehydrogenase Mo-binding subunit